MTKSSALSYLSGFGNEHASEALAGALPLGRNSPQRAPLGLYAEQLSGSAFTLPRHLNRRSWLYRIRPSAMHGAFHRIEHAGLHSAPLRDVELSPNRLRWNPLPVPQASTDFIDGLYTMGSNGDPGTQSGIAVHLYAANRSMTDRVFFNADGELLMVPQAGALNLVTEFGRLDVAPGEIAVIGRGIRFRVELKEKQARGYLCENYGAPLTLPELGPLGANALAQARDFLVPVASFEDRSGPVEVIGKFGGRLWAAQYAHSPLDVVAWHGNYVPYKYDLANFMVINTVSFDHPDPSIFTVLTSASATTGLANVDFVIFPPRWMVAENTFRPPWFHRNIMSEFMGLVLGAYDAKAEGFLPGGASLHNCMSAHGPDLASFERASSETLEPRKITGTLAFMFESRWPITPTAQAMAASHRQADYDRVWDGFKKHFVEK